MCAYDMKTVKKDRIEIHKEQLEGLEAQAERMAQQREHADQQWEFSLSLVEDLATRENLKRLHDEADTRFRERFRNEIEEPSDRIHKELDDDYKELSEESRKEQYAAERVNRTDVDAKVKAEAEAALQKSATEFSQMAQAANDVKAVNFDKIATTRTRVYGMYK